MPSSPNKTIFPPLRMLDQHECLLHQYRGGQPSAILSVCGLDYTGLMLRYQSRQEWEMARDFTMFNAVALRSVEMVLVLHQLGVPLNQNCSVEAAFNNDTHMMGLLSGLGLTIRPTIYDIAVQNNNAAMMQTLRELGVRRSWSSRLM